MPAGDVPRMEVQADPVPDSALEAIAGAREAAHRTMEAVERLEQMVAARDTPADMRPIVLTQSVPTVWAQATWQAKSIALLNPTGIKVYIGHETRASAEARAPSVPPQSLLVLPILVEDIEIGADPADLAAGDAVCWLLRFHAVQHPLLKSL